MQTNIILPSCGFFGSEEFNCLDLLVDDEIFGIELRISSADAEILNLLSIEIFSADGKKVELSPLSLEQSSALDETYGPLGLITGKGIHTHREANPYWRTTFAGMKIARIAIRNRPDMWGERSRTLVVSVLRNDQWTKIHDPCSVGFFIENVANINKLIGLSNIDNRNILLTESDWRRSALKSIFEVAHTSDWHDPVMIKSASQMIDFESKDGIYDNLIAAIIFGWSKRHDLSAEFLSNYSRIMSTAERIIYIEDAINEIAGRTKGDSKLYITKHGVVRPVLHERSSEFIQLARDVMAHLSEIGVESCIGYGTLLGAIRSGNFLPFDDDLDLLFAVKEPHSPERSAIEREIIEKLKASGFSIAFQSNFRNMHVIRNNIAIDLFPCWIEKDRASLYMEKMNIRTIDADILFPCDTTELVGETLPAPRDARAFLKHRYGADWNVPDRFHEWPWRLSAPVLS